MPKFPPSDLSKNQLLARLPPTEYQRLSPKLEAVHLPVKRILYKAYASIDYVYFPTNGIVSAMTVMEDGSAIEVATIGNEGLVGLSAFIGGETSPYELMVQVEGDAMRMRADLLKAESHEEGPLRRILSLYNTALQTQIGYSVACNGLHAIKKRCCRWLLMTQDRIESNVLPLTHDFLSIMLGVRRSSVTEVLQPLQEEGLIQNERGKIRVLNRKGLEGIVCECYRRTKEEFTRLFDLAGSVEVAPGYNIAPPQPMTVVRPKVAYQKADSNG
jgi:CRP-like cAMP-binding protein